MNRFWLISMAVMLGGVLLTGGGCASEELKEAKAMLRNANAQLDLCHENLRKAREENDQLRADLGGRGDILEAKNREISVLEQQNADLRSKLSELKALYDRKMAEGGPPALPPLPAAVDQALREFARNNPDLLTYLPDYGMVKFKSDLTFPPGSDNVKPSAQEALQKFVEIVNTPAAREFNVYVAGHTDDMPIAKAETKRRHPNNWYLSVHRAVAVQQVLTGAGLTPERIGALGFGEYHPVEPNRPNQRGNSANRRVEIWLVPPDRFLTQSMTPAGGGEIQPQPTK